MEPSQPPFTISSQLAIHSLLTHFRKMPIQVVQPIKGNAMLFMAAVKMSKSGPIICVNSWYAETK